MGLGDNFLTTLPRELSSLTGVAVNQNSNANNNFLDCSQYADILPDGYCGAQYSLLYACLNITSNWFEQHVKVLVVMLMFLCVAWLTMNAKLCVAKDITGMAIIAMNATYQPHVWNVQAKRCAQDVQLGMRWIEGIVSNASITHTAMMVLSAVR